MAATNQTGICIDDFGPLEEVRPATTDDLCAVVAESAQTGSAIYPVGGRTMLGFGLPPSKPGRAVDMTALNSVIDYPARDMTITVQAGIRIAELQRILDEEGQRLPIDVADAERSTLGGAIAVNMTGPRRFGYGTWRDYLIGMSAANDEGVIFKAGGRVVKNVAGYDLCKLMIGSLGTLGVLTQVTLKVPPKPEQQALISLAMEFNDVAAMLEALHRTKTRPVCLELLNPSAAEELVARCNLSNADSWRIVVGFEGNTETVKWQVQQLIREVGTQCAVEANFGCTAQAFWNILTEFPKSAADDSASRMTFKANLLPSGAAAFCGHVQNGGETVRIKAHAGNGIIVGHVENLADANAAHVFLDSLRKTASEHRGTVVVTQCPSAWKADVSVWGLPPTSIALMHAIKEKWDPKNILNPGRFVDGI